MPSFGQRLTTILAPNLVYRRLGTIGREDAKALSLPERESCEARERSEAA